MSCSRRLRTMPAWPDDVAARDQEPQARGCGPAHRDAGRRSGAPRTRAASQTGRDHQLVPDPGRNHSRTERERGKAADESTSAAVPRPGHPDSRPVKAVPERATMIGMENRGLMPLAISDRFGGTGRPVGTPGKVAVLVSAVVPASPGWAGRGETGIGPETLHRVRAAWGRLRSQRRRTDAMVLSSCRLAP